MQELAELSPREFEELSVEYLRSKGFTDVRRVGQAGDLGVDVRCYDPQGRLVVAQCKRYRVDRIIGSPSIQHFFGMVVHAGAARGIFITTSDYTQPARNLARERDIELVDGSEIDAFYRRKTWLPNQVGGERQVETSTQKREATPSRSWLSRLTSNLKAREKSSSLSESTSARSRPQEANTWSKQRGGRVDPSLFSQKFCFEHVGGDLLYPIRIRNKKSGRLEFQVWDKDKSHAIGVEEERMVDLVLNSGNAVRMKCPVTGRNGGYRRNGPSIKSVRRAPG
jgi:hypothetical protein